MGCCGESLAFGALNPLVAGLFDAQVGTGAAVLSHGQQRLVQRELEVISTKAKVHIFAFHYMSKMNF